MNEREKFVNLIFKYVVKANNNSIEETFKNSTDIMESVYENVDNLYECENIPLYNLFALLDPDNDICPIDTEGLDVGAEIKKERAKCIELYCS